MGHPRGSGHFYIGMASGKFKNRFYNHKKSFNDERYAKFSELGKFVWKLKNRNVQFKVHFESIAFSKPYRRETGKCEMCLREKIEISNSIKCNGSKSLNRRNELYRNCVHRHKHLLGTINTRLKPPDAGNVMIYPHITQSQGQRREWGQTRSGKQWRNSTS